MFAVLKFRYGGGEEEDVDGKTLEDRLFADVKEEKERFGKVCETEGLRKE